MQKNLAYLARSSFSFALPLSSFYSSLVIDLSKTRLQCIDLVQIRSGKNLNLVQIRSGKASLAQSFVSETRKIKVSGVGWHLKGSHRKKLPQN